MLETSSCIVYSFHASYRYKNDIRALKSLGNEIISEFIGQCKQKKTQLCMTQTVKDESLATLSSVMNRHFDRAGISAHPVRTHVYLKLRKRFLELESHCKLLNVVSNLAPVKAMYVRFSKDSELAKKLEELRNMKRRNSIFPSENDMKILGEAHRLGQTYKVYFVTDDKDFTYFKDDIQKELNVTVVELLDLPHLTL